MDYKKILLSKIERFINSEDSLDQFHANYYMYYVDEIPDGALTDSESFFYGTIQEQWDFVAEDPNEDDRKYGYINVQEYKKWIQRMIDKLAEFHGDYTKIQQFINSDDSSK